MCELHNKSQRVQAAAVSLATQGCLYDAIRDNGTLLELMQQQIPMRLVMRQDLRYVRVLMELTIRPCVFCRPACCWAHLCAHSVSIIDTDIHSSI